MSRVSRPSPPPFGQSAAEGGREGRERTTLGNKKIKLTPAKRTEKGRAAAGAGGFYAGRLNNWHGGGGGGGGGPVGRDAERGREPHLTVGARAKVLVTADLGLELDKVLGHLVGRPLGEDPEDGPAGLVHVDPPAQRQPAGAGALKVSWHNESWALAVFFK